MRSLIHIIFVSITTLLEVESFTSLNNYAQKEKIRLGFKKTSNSVVVWSGHKNNDFDMWSINPLTLETARLESPSLSINETVHWCANFVVDLQLCPWAKSSLETTNALHLFRVAGHQGPITADQADQVIAAVGNHFEDFLRKATPELEASAIFFVIFDDPDFNSILCDFGQFYNWFDDLEQSSLIGEDVTIAPFHPSWNFGVSDDGDGEEELLLNYEKRSPWPTISFVSSRIIDKAGPVASEQIAENNFKVLTGFAHDELKSFWYDQVKAKPNEGPI